MGKQGKGKKKKGGYVAPRRNISGNERGTEEKAKANPFELQINKRKHVTLGRTGRQERGHPGLAKSRGIAKRKRTLLKDYLSKDKSNSLVDRRIGERSKSLPEEAKIVRRAAVEKKKQYKKKSIFNLNDDDDMILTHKGRHLDSVDRYEDPRDSSDSEDERLNEAFVGEANFGGFMKRKPMEDDGAMLGSDGAEKSRAEIIDELIRASKIRKHAKSTEDAALFEKILELDESLKGLTPELFLKPSNKLLDDKGTAAKSDYDRSLKELQFERKGKATDRLKTAEEIAEAEKDNLERLEQERRRQMDMYNFEPTSTHRSADALEERYTPEKGSSTLAYSSGKLVKSDSENSDDEEIDEDQASNGSDETISSDDDDSEENTGGGDMDTILSKSKTCSLKKTDPEVKKTNQSSVLANKANKDKASLALQFSRIPYAMAVPLTFAEFQSAINEACCIDDMEGDGSIFFEEVRTFLNRVVAYNKVAKPSDLPRLCKYILQLHKFLHEHLRQLGYSLHKCCVLVDSFIPSLDLIVGVAPNMAAKEFLKVLKKLSSEYTGESVPNDLFGLLLIISRIFSTTDFKHSVVIPALTLIARILKTTKIKSVEQARELIPMCGLMHEFTRESKRFCPEVIRFLKNIMDCFDPDKRVNVVNVGIRLSLWNLSNAEKVCLTQEILHYVDKLIILYKNLLSAPEIFEPINNSLKRFKTNFKSGIQDETQDIFRAIDSTISSIEALRTEKETLKGKRPKPVMIRLYDPEISSDFTTGTKRLKTQKESGKLAAKVKREMKGAIRELKKDNAFLGRQQREEELRIDTERKEKTKAILSSLANQEGEYQKLKKTK